VIARFPLLFVFLIMSCSEETEKGPAPPPSYQTLHLPGLNGSYFHFEYEGDFYIACSIHQGGASRGAEIFLTDDPSPVTLKKRFHKQQDLQVWTYQASTLSTDAALNYQKNPQVSRGDQVFILNKGEKIPGTIVSEPSGKEFRHYLETKKEFPANGMSGSPVFLPRTGSVIGVLQTANDKKAATLGGFELLTLP